MCLTMYIFPAKYFKMASSVNIVQNIQSDLFIMYIDVVSVLVLIFTTKHRPTHSILKFKLKFHNRYSWTIDMPRNTHGMEMDSSHSYFVSQEILEKYSGVL